MKLFRRKNQAVEGSDADVSIQRPRAARLLILIALVIAAVALVGVLTLGGNQADTAKPAGQKTVQKPVASQPQPAKPSSASDNLVNTGPGDVVAVFVATSLVASGLYYRRLLNQS